MTAYPDTFTPLSGYTDSYIGKPFEPVKAQSLACSFRDTIHFYKGLGYLMSVYDNFDAILVKEGSRLDIGITRSGFNSYAVFVQARA